MVGTKYNIIKGDAFELIKTLDNNSIDLLITSPPYNVGKIYEKEVDFNSYLKPYAEFAKVAFDKVSPKGVFVGKLVTTLKMAKFTL
jgi:adenine-specific DNA-methyltransferase